jgi:hypothetical protein
MSINLGDFQKQIEQEKLKVTTTAVRAQVYAIIGIHDRLIDRPQNGGTPIDTRRASASWFVQANSPGSDMLLEGEYSESAAKSSQSKVNTNTVKIGSTWYVYNNVPYIRRLNAGHSKQAAAMFVEAAVAAQNAEMSAFV